jgi:hypothetical protein
MGIYFALLIYLFSMDPGDSFFVVMLLSAFDFVARWVLMILLLGLVLSWGGVGGTGLPAIGGGGGPPSGGSEVTARVKELKESKALEEARAFIADGHQGVLSKTVEAWYAEGCPNVWFSVDRDFNGKRDPNGVIVELPKDKAKRAKCYEILKAYYDLVRIEYEPEDLKDTGERYIEVELL